MPPDEVDRDHANATDSLAELSALVREMAADFTVIQSDLRELFVLWRGLDHDMCLLYRQARNPGVNALCRMNAYAQFVLGHVVVITIANCRRDSLSKRYFERKPISDVFRGGAVLAAMKTRVNKRARMRGVLRPTAASPH